MIRQHFIGVEVQRAEEAQSQVEIIRRAVNNLPVIFGKMRFQFAIILLLLIFIGTIFLTASSLDHPDSNNFTLCATKECEDIAAYILEGLDPRKDPCDDFYKFACGQWRTTNPLPQGKEHWSRFTVVEQQTKERLIKILEANDEVNVSKPVALMREYYRDCMDLGTLDRIGIEPVDTILKGSGDWPLLRAVSRETISWQELDDYYLELTGEYSLFDIKIDADYDDRSNNRIEINRPEFPIADAFSFERKWTDFSEDKIGESSYVKFIMGIVDVFLRYRNVSYSQVELDKDISEMVIFEYQLYEAQKMQGMNRKNTIKELHENYDDSLPIPHNKTADINWLKLITNLFNSTNYLIGASEVIYVSNWNYISRLAELLNDTPNHVIVNYIHWNFVAKIILFTNEETRHLIFDVHGKDFIKNRFARQHECLIECRLSHVLFYEYAKKYFPQSAKENTLKTAEKVRKRVFHAVSQFQWLDEATRSILLEKVSNVHMMIGYPDWYNDEAFGDYYENLEYGATYFEKILNYMKFAKLMNLQKFRQPMTKYVWQVQPTSAVARYAYYYNALMFPMAIVQGHDCCNHLPRSVRYGLDGFIIGHEIFHALDPEGIQYDKNWQSLNLPKKTRRKYDKIFNCLTDQADSYLFTDIDPLTEEIIWIQANGTFSKKEDFVDTAGIAVSFEAYRDEFVGNDIRLPGLEDYDSDKMFFISFATKWCRMGTRKWWEETFGTSYYDEGHSPSQLRINNPLINFDAFSTAFNCKKTDRMMEKSKCSIFNN